MSTKFDLLINIDLLKAVTSRNRKPELELSSRGRHLQNLLDVIFPHWMVRYGWSLGSLCRISSGLRWRGQSRNWKKNFNVADDCFSQTEIVIFRPWIELSWRHLVCWYILTFWSKWLTQSETGSKIAPQQPPFWKSIRRHISAASDPIWVKCCFLTQNDMTIMAMKSKLKLKNMTNWKRTKT